MGNVNGQTVVPPDLKAGPILQALGDTLPGLELSRLGAFLAGERPLEVDDADAQRIVDALKTAADRHWQIDPHRSVELADVIIAIGEARRDIGIRALGAMAKGDAVKFIGSQQAAWDLLEEAARLFNLIGDGVGWARTWIGRLFVAAQLNRLPEAIEQAGKAREIFEQHGEALRLIRLDMTLGMVNWQTENHAVAEARYDQALRTALKLGDGATDEARAIYNNLGLISQSRGEHHRALDYFAQAARLARAQGLETAEVICRLNMATSRKQLGEYRQALAMLHEIQPRYMALHGVDTQLQSDMADCLMALNRLEDADALYGIAREAWLREDSRLNAARTALSRAMAEAGLGDSSGAHALLDLAEAEFARSGETGLTALVKLRRGQLALREKEPARALALAQAACARFTSEGQSSLEAEAALLEADALLDLGDTAGAGKALVQTLERARACASPALMYSAHLSLGRVAEREGRHARALRRYAAAEAVVERVQRNLTMTLRPAFLSSALAAQRARASLQLRLGNVAGAFETVERVRAQIARGYLSGRESLRWTAGDPLSAQLAAALAQLRGRHHLLAARSASQGDRPGSVESPPPREALAALERQMKALTEQLHLRRPDDALEAVGTPQVAHLQQALGEDEALTAYFDDGTRLHAFALDRNAITHAPLEIDARCLCQLMEQLQRNLARALAAGGGRAAGALLAPARSILEQLWDSLLAPVAPRMGDRRRLFIAPCGQLHALPFNLLFKGARYLIERAEIVTLPSASMLLRPSPRRAAGARVFVFDDEGRLPDVEREAEILRARFPSEVWSGAAATRAALRASPRQILHVAAHGAHRTDNPDFSHITLADGQLMTDDLLQMDLSYELVTLSACETGRGRVTAGDEALGVGWAFLYAGAGAVVSSLWRVSDARTAPLMAAIYESLQRGLSKAEALRRAQMQALEEEPGAHPAFWGAFQLFGSPAALSRAGSDTGGALTPPM